MPRSRSTVSVEVGRQAGEATGSVGGKLQDGNMRRGIAILKDRPGAASAVALLIVGAHILAAHRWRSADTAGTFSEAKQLVDVYVGFAGVAALVAGFVGVLVVFATTTGPDWSKVRNLGGASLRRNWLSPVRSTLSAAFLATFAALAEQIGHGRVAWWVFEVALLVTASAGLRVLWLLGGLLRVQQNMDRAAVQQANRPTLTDLGMPETGPAP